MAAKLIKITYEAPSFDNLIEAYSLWCCGHYFRRGEELNTELRKESIRNWLE